MLPTYEPARLGDLAVLAEGAGFDDFWLADERFFREVYACLTLCALRTRRIRLGPCVTDPYTRHPALTAVAIATLDEISGRRAVLGIGAGVSGFRELGIDASRSAAAIREAVEVIRRLLAGETVTVKGREVSLSGGRLDFTAVRADLPIFVASQRPAGCRVAGRVADGAIMQGALAEPLVRFLRETVQGAARDAGRDPARVALVARLNVCIHDDRAAARDVMRPTIVRSLAAQRPDFFTFRTAGLTLPAGLRDKVLALPYTHEVAPLRAVAPEVPDAFVDACTLSGPPEVIAPELVRLARSGIAEVVIYPLAVDGRPETTIERFQAEVMPRVRRELGA
ncbi:MAG TPA: LLM class flavin-dependent oxidoreductase [Methylomirabilota bacterium]|jgi:5,10-methylenetetrahydromethanopterin reductase|nr:LLM class flavin-dependent oxidoreductase [Methylomirabilota bacterium]